MFKDRSRLLLLGALVLLFIVLTNGGFNIHLGHFRFFDGGRLLPIALIALAVWFICRPGGCFRGCCRPNGGEEEAETPDESAEGEEEKA